MTSWWYRHEDEYFEWRSMVNHGESLAMYRWTFLSRVQGQECATLWRAHQAVRQRGRLKAGGKKRLANDLEMKEPWNNYRSKFNEHRTNIKSNMIPNHDIFMESSPRFCLSNHVQPTYFATVVTLQRESPIISSWHGWHLAFNFLKELKEVLDAA